MSDSWNERIVKIEKVTVKILGASPEAFDIDFMN